MRARPDPYDTRCAHIPVCTNFLYQASFGPSQHPDHLAPPVYVFPQACSRQASAAPQFSQTDSSYLDFQQPAR